ncbi:MAG: DUF2628 domain-containing protein [Eubacterium sp.]|nr:DUF2628 domain-containing protein [Eubacterium sp.]
MFLYENEICPVCSREFERGDDIVTCPECGTPHHRECYKDYGGCKNRSLHGTDFVYKRGEGVSAPKVEKSFKYSPFLTELPLGEEKKDEYYKPENAESIENSETGEKPEALEQAVSEAAEPQENQDEIDGVKTEDVVSVVAVNTFKFLPKFKRNKLFNWNWSAFFFGSYYLFFRKMYVQGAVFMALDYVISLVVSAAFMSAGVAYAKVFVNVKTPNDYLEAWNTFSADPEFKNYMIATAIILVSTIVLHIICAMLADSLYRKKVFNIIRIVDEKIKMGESFSLIGPMMSMETNMSQKDMRKIFLSRQGGVNPWAPLFAMIITNFLLRML